MCVYLCVCIYMCVCVFVYVYPASATVVAAPLSNSGAAGCVCYISLQGMADFVYIYTFIGACAIVCKELLFIMLACRVHTLEDFYLISQNEK